MRLTSTKCGIYTLGKRDEVNWRLVSSIKMSEIARDCMTTCNQAHKTAKSKGLLHQLKCTDIRPLKSPITVHALRIEIKEVATAFGTGLLQHKIWSEEGNHECCVETPKPIGQGL